MSYCAMVELYLGLTGGDSFSHDDTIASIPNSVIVNDLALTLVPVVAGLLDASYAFRELCTSKASKAMDTRTCTYMQHK